MIKKVYVIHHSHTDIGFTHGQSRIVRWHNAFIRQAMAIAQRRNDFAWTCETFYPVEQFWLDASADEREQFKSLCMAGRIGLTGCYLHFTELCDTPLLQTLAGRARAFADEHQLPLAAGMFADINGIQLVHARALAASGIKLLITCVHPHHGYVPLGKRQELFNWDLGDGQTITVLLADHYHTGNELGFAPGAEANYTAGFSDSPGHMDDDVLERRLPDYLRRAEDAGWKHDFLTIAVSGLNTDNGPPSEAIADRIARWNQAHQGGVQIQMITPTELARMTSATNSQLHLPTYTGDWPDWWADGVAGDPEAVMLFRHAQRQRRWLTALSADNQPAEQEMEKLDTSLALFAEHTFGHSGAIGAPWNLLAHQLHLRKVGYAADAADHAEAIFDAVDANLGGGPLAFYRIPAFRVLNPFDHTIRHLVELEIEACEAQRWHLSARSLRIVNKTTGQAVPHQLAPSLRGVKAIVDVTLKPGEQVDLAMESADALEDKSRATRIMVPDGMHDIAGDAGSVAPASLETPFVSIRWAPDAGIVSWRDVQTNRELIAPTTGRAPFTLRASRLPALQDGPTQCDVRRQLGRNRNAASALWSRSVFQRVLSFDRGAHFDLVELDYTLAGCDHVRLRLAAWKHAPRVDVELRIAKQGTWDAENIYLDLPFSAGDDAQLWVDRGVPIRPGIDQIPGTLIDFMGVQDGLASCSPAYGVAVAQLDSHLIQLGPLEYGVRQVAAASATPSKLPWAWLMTNYWETNFSADLGGFYSFRFSVLWGDALRDPATALAQCRDATTGLRAIRLSGES